MAKDAVALVVRIFDQPELFADDAGNIVVARQALVDYRVIGTIQIQYALVFLNEVIEEQLRFMAHRVH